MREADPATPANQDTPWGDQPAWIIVADRAGFIAGYEAWLADADTPDAAHAWETIVAVMLRTGRRAHADDIAAVADHGRTLPVDQPDTAPATGAAAWGRWTHAVGSAVIAGVKLTPDILWSTSPLLNTICASAEALRASPEATLGVTIARVLSAVSTAVKLPALVGGKGSLNYGAVLVGRSGAGKGVAISASRHAVQVIGEADWIPIGSGEGLSHIYGYRPRPTRAEPNPGIERIRQAAIVITPEIDSVFAQQSRRGSTLGPQLRMALSGEQLGAQYVDPQKRIIIDEHSYRLAFVAGAQPDHTAGLLTGPEASGGTPQRIMWFPAWDLQAPEGRRPKPPPSSQLDIAGIPIPPMRDGVQVCDTARDDVDRTAQQRLRTGHRTDHDPDDPDSDPLDSHRGILKLRVALAIALLTRRRLEITDQDWGLAELVMQISGRTRRYCLDVIRNEADKANEAKARAEAQRDAIVEQGRDERYRSQTRTVIMKMLTKTGTPQTRTALSRGLKGTTRPLLDVVIDELIEQGLVVPEVDEYHGQPRTTYRISSK
jgi:hypothetical protein